MTLHVAIRLPSAGTLLGDLVREHAGSRVTTIPVARSPGRVDHLALVEGVPDHAVAQMLLAWNLRYGVPAQVLGDPFALRLPVLVPAIGVPAIESLLAMDADLQVAGSVGEADWFEQWIACPDADAAHRLVARLRGRLGAHVLDVDVRAPRPQDLDCWAVLHEADLASAPLADALADASLAAPA